MYLCEEYFHRHGMDVQYVRHVERGAVFFKTDYDSTWRILSIDWEPPSVHPGTYDIKTIKPVHDGYRGRALFEPATYGSLFIHWDEYERFIMKWVVGAKNHRLASNVKEANLAAWEMLLCCFDVAINEQGYQERFYCTTDIALSADERFIALQESLVFISKYFIILHDAWTHEMGPHLRNYCYWLTDLVKDY